MDNLLLDSLDRLFAQHFLPATLRSIEAGGDTQAPWDTLEHSGFLDLLLPEDAGGAGLALTEAFPLFLSAGYHAIPLPYVQTVLARAWLNAAGISPPPGAIAIAGIGTQQSGKAISAEAVSFGRGANWILTELDSQNVLLPAAAAQPTFDLGHGSLLATLHWEKLPEEAQVINAAIARHTLDHDNSRDHSASSVPGSAGANPRNSAGIVGTHIGAGTASDSAALIALPALAAASHAPLLAGAAARVLSMTLEYANQRTQFGKNIGRFQAIQNQISVMAERVYAARMAAQLACQSPGWSPTALSAAVGKSRCSEAASMVADIGHAVHGAIGITEEYDLQLYTRRLREWRHAAGTEQFWNIQLGTSLLQAPEHSALSFICEALTSAPG